MLQRFSGGPVCRTGVRDFQPAGACVWRGSRRGRRPTSDASHRPRPCARGHVERGDYDAELAERYGWINRALPASTRTTSFGHSPIGSPSFLLPASSLSRSGLTQSRSRWWRTFVAISISSAKARKSRRPKAVSAAFKRGFQTRDAEMDPGRLLGQLGGS